MPRLVLEAMKAVRHRSEVDLQVTLRVEVDSIQVVSAAVPHRHYREAEVRPKLAL